MSKLRNCAVILLAIVATWLPGPVIADGARIEGNSCLYTWTSCPDQCEGTCPENCDDICRSLDCAALGYPVADTANATCSSCVSDEYCVNPFLKMRQQVCTCVRSGEEY